MKLNRSTVKVWVSHVMVWVSHNTDWLSHITAWFMSQSSHWLSNTKFADAEVWVTSDPIMTNVTVTYRSQSNTCHSMIHIGVTDVTIWQISQYDTCHRMIYHNMTCHSIYHKWQSQYITSYSPQKINWHQTCSTFKQQYENSKNNDRDNLSKIYLGN